MDKYIDGKIFTDFWQDEEAETAGLFYRDKEYRCPQPHPFVDGEDVTGRWRLEQWCNNHETFGGVDTFVQEVSSMDVSGCPKCYVKAVPIQPTATEHQIANQYGEKGNQLKDVVGSFPDLPLSTEQKEQGDDWVRVVKEKFDALETLVTKFGELGCLGNDCEEYMRLYNIWKPGTFPNNH